MTGVLFASVHGKTRGVVGELRNYLRFPFASRDVASSPSVEEYKRVLFFCPTYGDEELPHVMEDYLLSLPAAAKEFAVCELGNYYGFEDTEFGASRIIRRLLAGKGWVEFFPPLSLDSFPKVRWDLLAKWSERLNEFMDRARS